MEENSYTLFDQFNDIYKNFLSKIVPDKLFNEIVLRNWDFALSIGLYVFQQPSLDKIIINSDVNKLVEILSVFGKGIEFKDNIKDILSSEELKAKALFLHKIVKGFNT